MSGYIILKTPFVQKLNNTLNYKLYEQDCYTHKRNINQVLKSKLISNENDYTNILNLSQKCLFRNKMKQIIKEIPNKFLTQVLEDRKRLNQRNSYFREKGQRSQSNSRDFLSK